MVESSGRRLVTRDAFVWFYVVALTVLAGGGWALFTHGAEPHAEPHLAWWAVALGFAGA
jgi:hypothetical protein